MGASSDNVHGLILAVSSSVLIGSSFIIKKKGLIKAGCDGTRAVIFGEIANFAAYAFAPAILVTPLGALSIIFSSSLFYLEKLHIFGVLGCVLCVVGSTEGVWLVDDRCIHQPSVILHPWHSLCYCFIVYFQNWGKGNKGLWLGIMFALVIQVTAQTGSKKMQHKGML